MLIACDTGATAVFAPNMHALILSRATFAAPTCRYVVEAVVMVLIRANAKLVILPLCNATGTTIDQVRVCRTFAIVAGTIFGHITWRSRLGISESLQGDQDQTHRSTERLIVKRLTISTTSTGVASCASIQFACGGVTAATCALRRHATVAFLARIDNAIAAH